MKRILALALLLACLLAGNVEAADLTLTAVVTQTDADTSGSLLVVPTASQTILIKRITLFYDNAANTNPIYAGIVTANAAHTRSLWLGQAMTSSGIATVQYDNINRLITPATAQTGLRLFVSAASSDSIMGIVEYELVPR